MRSTSGSPPRVSFSTAGGDRCNHENIDRMSARRDNRKLRVAAAQAEARAGDVSANAETAARLIESATAAGAAVIVFPELFLCGYDLATIRESPDRTDVTVDDARLDPVRAACDRERAVAVVGASLVRAEERTISALVFGRGGEVRATYEKTHLHHDERDLFAAGARHVLLELDGWRMGVGICYDASFPEHARAAAVAGADAYLCPSAFFADDSDHRRSVYFAARALENTFYVVFANFVGTHGGAEFCGQAAVYAPDGRTLADAGRRGAAIATAELDRAVLDATRESLTMLRDRADTPEQTSVTV
jgi:5-aminopentanamidase